MDRKIAYYFEKIEGLSHSDDLEDLTDLHTRSFEQHGWEVIHLDESNSKQHPLYSVFDDRSSIFASSRNGWEYTRACYMRWLAYASAGCFFADFDVINYGFSYDDALEMRGLAGGPTFLSGATAVGLFEKDEYSQILNAFIEYKAAPFVAGSLNDDVNDMTILLQCRPKLFAITGTEDIRIARDYSCPGWEQAQLVHYPYHYVKPPRSKTVRDKRPPVLEDTKLSGAAGHKSAASDGSAHDSPAKVWSAHMSRLDVINGILSLCKNSTYLEIGAETIDTFLRVEAYKKVAVSPSSPFHAEHVLSSSSEVCNVFASTSDYYFGHTAVPGERYDVVFLCGLHTMEQAVRDLCNALAFLSADGVVVIDNVIPSSFHAAIPDAKAAQDIRNILDVKDGMWMGDVYKIVFFIQSFLQQYDYAVVLENHGQLVLWKSQRPAERMVHRNMEVLARQPYESVLLQSADFNRMPYREIIKRLEQSRTGHTEK